ncbi:hypothetical protein SporoP37_10050 [Sporosarcina sp. P37]|uniref:spore cortex biosynthesis protein YabQ n=1 Tax=unclassified Sporosarcina TaxID=2647733 RepID=UPI0009BFE3E1|nr:MULTISPECIES: spore cortex biosynthesis protein YabQ [unclassified Sporosarcina]ARD48465.1 hypothetical protein SporoP33_09655 [Sporosarcina sp. P33]ARK24971.1 hypothetical protein SporoP37_10050 [Sporosarcina sp. P37]PID18110.1 hypothetical protein CSV62_10245 [Sporosarcina sp. P35]
MSLSVQFFSLLAMIGTGIAAGIVMDLFGTIVAASDKRSFIKRWAFWFECMVWIGLGIGAFLVLIMVRGGAWRMYDPVAQISGLLLYAAVFYHPARFAGRLLLLVVLRPIWLIIRLVFLTCRRIIYLIVSVLSLIMSPFIRIAKNIGKFLQNKCRVLYNRVQ